MLLFQVSLREAQVSTAQEPFFGLGVVILIAVWLVILALLGLLQEVAQEDLVEIVVVVDVHV